jgi:undecaprenyl-diphosphatase
MFTTFPLDIAVFNAIHGLAGLTPLLDALGIFLALYLPYLLGLAALAFVFKQKTAKEKWGVFLALAFAVLVSRGILTEAVHFLYPIARPFAALGFTPLIGESGASFPSGHAAFFFALSFMLFAFDRKWGAWFLTLAFINGLARIFVGVHYPMDILGGIVVGFISYLIVQYLLKPGRFRAAAVPQAVQDASGENAAPGQVA